MACAWQQKVKEGSKEGGGTNTLLGLLVTTLCPPLAHQVLSRLLEFSTPGPQGQLVWGSSWDLLGAWRGGVHPSPAGTNVSRLPLDCDTALGRRPCQAQGA